MGYELLVVFMFFAILCSCMSIITLTLCKVKQPGLKPDYELADSYIRHLQSGNGYNRKSKKTADLSYCDLSYLRNYLAIHLVKYPDGKLPVLAGTMTMQDDKVTHTVTFYDCYNPDNDKYLKKCFKLLKPVKVKQVRVKNVLAQANQIVKTRKRKLELQPV